MGLWDTIKQHAGAQFLDVIEWLEDDRETIVYRFPVMDQAITDNSKLVVREGQAAVFVSEGKMSDVFGPGTYTLGTQNTPIVSFFKSIAYGLNYPYKGDIYFVSTRQFTEQKWGTPNPIMMRDAEFGPVRLRAFGIYSFRVTDPATFLRQLVGTDGLVTTKEIAGQFKRKLTSAFADTLGQARIPALDLAARYMSLGDQLRDRMNPAFQEAYGITLVDFTIENISLPEAVEKALDTRSKMGVLGDLDAYAKLQAADAISIAAANEGLGGAGIGMGVGFGMGNMVGNQMAGGFAGGGGQVPPPAHAPPQPPPPPHAATFHYNGPTGQAQLSAQEVIQRVSGDPNARHLVWQAGWPNWQSWKDVPELAAAVPPPVAPPSPNVVYHYHGPAGEGQKTLAEVLKLLETDPSGDHKVWRAGWKGWRPARDADEVRRTLAEGGPPPPPQGPPPIE